MIPAWSAAIANPDGLRRDDQCDIPALHIQQRARVAYQPDGDPPDPLSSTSSLPRQQLSRYDTAQIQQRRKRRRITNLPEGHRQIHPHRQVAPAHTVISQKRPIEHMSTLAVGVTNRHARFRRVPRAMMVRVGKPRGHPDRSANKPAAGQPRHGVPLMVKRDGVPLPGRTVPQVVSQLCWRVEGPFKGRARSVVAWASLDGAPTVARREIAEQFGVTPPAIGQRIKRVAAAGSRLPLEPDLELEVSRPSLRGEDHRARSRWAELLGRQVPLPPAAATIERRSPRAVSPSA